MATDKGVDPIHLEAYGGLSHLKNAGLHDASLAGGALEGAAQEHSMGVWQGLKTYKRAAFWSVCEFPAERGFRTATITLPSQLTVGDVSDINYRHHGGL